MVWLKHSFWHRGKWQLGNGLFQREASFNIFGSQQRNIRFLLRISCYVICFKYTGSIIVWLITEWTSGSIHEEISGRPSVNISTLYSAIRESIFVTKIYVIFRKKWWMTFKMGWLRLNKTGPNGFLLMYNIPLKVIHARKSNVCLM